MNDWHWWRDAFFWLVNFNSVERKKKGLCESAMGLKLGVKVMKVRFLLAESWQCTTFASFSLLCSINFFFFFFPSQFSTIYPFMVLHHIFLLVFDLQWRVLFWAFWVFEFWLLGCFFLEKKTWVVLKFGFWGSFGVCLYRPDNQQARRRRKKPWPEVQRRRRNRMIISHTRLEISCPMYLTALPALLPGVSLWSLSWIFYYAYIYSSFICQKTTVFRHCLLAKFL